MRHGQGHVKGRRTYAAAGVLAACGLLAGVGAAGAASQADEVDIEVLASNAFDPTPANANTGDTVIWHWTNAGTAHNVRGTEGPPEDAVWVGKDSGFLAPPAGEYRYRFTKPGVYRYVCDAHANMTGEVNVTGEPVEPTPEPSPTVSPSPSATPTQTPTPTPTPAPVDGLSTPPPTASASADRIAPALSGLRVKRLRRGARVAFKLSEPATVTLRVRRRRSGKVIRTVRLQARPGTRTVDVRSSRLRRGRYTVEVQARDAAGNRTPLVRTSLRIGR